MGIKSTNNNYGTVAVIIHWLSALIIIGLILSGFRASGVEDNLAKAGFLRVHVSLGITVLILTVARIAWWYFADKKPEPAQMPNWQSRISKLTHVLFYVVILGMAVSGIGMIVLSEAATIIFSHDASNLPNFFDYKPRTPHGIGARFILLLLIFHVGGALYHHFYKKDGLLKRMWFQRKIRK